MLDEHAKEAFHGTQQRAVYHIRAVLLTVFADVADVETLRLVEVELNGRKLPFTSESVFDLDVNLRAVKSATASINFVRHLKTLQAIFQRGFGGLPLFRLANAFFGHGAEIGLEVGEAKSAQHLEAEVERKVDFIRHLVRATEVVRVVLGKATHAQQTMQYATAFVAVDRAFFGIAQGQVAVAVQLAFVDAQVEGAVHRF